ncbi:MAG: hypothetical protein GY799_06945 [Desulfobulbaceae bacterium]|nr:hypothetical protein [Desulfobulbaceae bacterium]
MTDDELVNMKVLEIDTVLKRSAKYQKFKIFKISVQYCPRMSPVVEKRIRQSNNAIGLA